MALGLKTRRSRRKINAGSATRSDRSQAIDQTRLNFIYSHPKYDTIVGSLRAGISTAEIARWFAEQDWLNGITDRTFAEYVGAFRRLKPEVIKGGDLNSLDGIVGAHMPNADAEVELQRLLRFQKIRLKIGHDRETAIQMPLDNVGKDVERAGRLIEALAKIQGNLDTAMNAAGMSADAGMAIKEIKIEEGQRDRMAALTRKLGKVLKDGLAKTA